MYYLFTGDDVGGTFTRKFYITIDTELDLTDCIVQFKLGDSTKTLTNVVAGERKEIVFSRNETLALGVGIRLGVLSIFDAQGRYRTLANDIMVKCTDVVAEVYDGEGNNVKFKLDCGVNWDAITGKPDVLVAETFAAVKEIGKKYTLKQVADKVDELIKLLKGEN